ncbi:MAG: radical SAM protein, partial [Planctomycetaceae bacterium]
FRRGVEFLRKAGMEARAFVLLQPHYLPADDAVEWALRSMEFAFDAGVRVVAVIPTRGGNGWLEGLALRGEFSPPTLAQLGEVLRRGLAMGRGRVFVDLWDAERLSPGGVEPALELALLRQWNLTQGR